MVGARAALAEGPRWGSQHPHGGLKSFGTSVSVNLMPSSDFTVTHTQNKNKQIIFKMPF